MVREAARQVGCPAPLVARGSGDNLLTLRAAATGWTAGTVSAVLPWPVRSAPERLSAAVAADAGRPGDEQHPLRMRVQVARPAQELDAGHRGHLTGGEKGQHRSRGVAYGFQPCQRGGRRVLADDVVVGGVPAGQLVLD
jgi:hypothetical protein